MEGNSNSARAGSSVVVRGGFSEVEFSAFFRKDVSRKGSALTEHVLQVEEERGESVVIRAKCIRGTKLQELPYRIELNFSKERKLQSGCHLSNAVETDSLLARAK